MKTGIWLEKMELPNLVKLAKKKISTRSLSKEATLGGTYLTKKKGRGMEFAEARPYQLGDDVRYIDWRVTARSGRTHTKLFREERERPVILVIDQSIPMSFGSRNKLKSVQSAHIASLLGWHALLRGDRVGGVLFSEKIHREFIPRADKRNYLGFLSNIMTEHNLVVDRMNEGGWNFNSKTLFSDVLLRVRRLAQPGSLIHILSDFSGFNTECRKQLFQISKHNDVKSYLIYDPLEKEIKKSGLYAMSDGNKTGLVNTVKSDLRKKYKDIFEKHLDEIKSEFRLCRVNLKIITTVDNILEV